MSLKHVKNYYLQVQEQYLQMVEDSKDFDEAIKGGFMDQAQYDQAQSMLGRIKENYERLSYIIYLFYQPNRDKKVAKFNKQNKKVYDHMNNSNYSKDAIIKENEDILKEFKKLIEGIKK
jgi:iron uptake system EfeUOB component EfeO/EfeM